MFASVKANPPVAQRVKTPEQLLAVVNARSKEMHFLPYTMKGLTVWIARQADVSGHDGEPSRRVDTILEGMVRKRRFEFPVEVELSEDDSVCIDNDGPRPKYLALPPHISLEVLVFNVPRGSVDRDGNHLKLDWSSVLIATALKKEERPHRKK